MYTPSYLFELKLKFMSPKVDPYKLLVEYYQEQEKKKEKLRRLNETKSR